MCVEFTYTRDMRDTHTSGGGLADRMGKYLLMTCMAFVYLSENLARGLCVFPMFSGFCWVHTEERGVCLVIFITV